MSKCTPWFPGTVKPVHVGVYERNMYGKRDPMCYALWDGKKWHAVRASIESAMRAEVSGYQPRTKGAPKWRGLSRKPE
jgi:hypothetical protein